MDCDSNRVEFSEKDERSESESKDVARGTRAMSHQEKDKHRSQFRWNGE